MNQKQMRTLVGEVIKHLCVSEQTETAVNIGKKLTDKQFEYLEKHFKLFNVEIDFNQIYSEKTNKLTKDKTTLLVGFL